MWITILQRGDERDTPIPAESSDESIRNSRTVIHAGDHWNVLIESPTLIVASSPKYSTTRPHIWIAMKQ